MPIYDFACKECGHRKEDLHFRSDEVPDSFHTYCESCGRPAAFELLVPRVHFEDWGQGRFFEHLSPQGMTFYDKGQYQRYLKAKGLSEWRPRLGMPHSEV